MYRRFCLVLSVLCLLNFGCRKAPSEQPAESSPPLLRLGPLLQNPSTKIESHIHIDAKNFEDYQGNGWVVANETISATQTSAVFLTPEWRRQQEWKLHFRARSTTPDRGLRVLVQGKEIASYVMTQEWRDYQITITPKDFEKPKIKQLQFVFSGTEAGTYADFQNFRIPVYVWGRTRVGNHERAAMVLRAKSRVIFDLTLPPGNPHLYFGAGLPTREDRTLATIFRMGIDSKKIYEKQLVGDQWTDEKLDLSEYAGKSIKLEFNTFPVDQDSDHVIAWSGPEIHDVAAQRDKPNIILFSVDTLRADRVSYHGHQRANTPNLDSLAHQSIVYKNAYCTFPGTLPSHTSVMTGLYVAEHQVGHRGEKIERVRRIAPEATMIAEVAQQGDYFTAGITDGGFVSGFYGFDQGFQQYSENDQSQNQNHIATISNAIQWLRVNSGRPFFLFLHTYIVHEPFAPSRDVFQKLFPDYPLKEGESPVVSMDWLLKVVSGKIVPTEKEKDFVKRCYEAEIFFFDQHFGTFLKELRTLNLDKNTVVLVFGDHGEMFFDRGNIFGHGKSLSLEEIKVPLILYIPGKAHEDRTDVVSLVDIFPTFSQMMGIKAADPVSGISLLEPSNSKLRTNRTIYYEVNYGKEAQWGIQSREFKLVLDQASGREFFYDLRKDPGEKNSMSGSGSRSMASMKQMLGNYIQQSIKPIARTKTVQEKEESRELKEQLKALGYLN